MWKLSNVFEKYFHNILYLTNEYLKWANKFKEQLWVLFRWINKYKFQLGKNCLYLNVKLSKSSKK